MTSRTAKEVAAAVRKTGAGYKKEQVMELLLGVALKTISDYLDYISPAPVDQAFAAESK